MVDWGDIYVLVFANGMIDTLLGLAIGVLVVARIAARRAKVEWTTWLMSKDAEPYMDKLALRVINKLPAIPTTEAFMEKIEPRIQGLEDRISQPLDLDLGPIVKEVTQNVVTEVDRIRAVIDGKMGWAAKVEKQTNELIASEVGQEVMESALSSLSPGQRKLYTRFKSYLADEKWVKANPAAAVGAEALIAEFESGFALNPGGRSSNARSSTATRRVGR